MARHKYFLDSNIFLRPVVKDVPEHTRECEALFQLLKQGEFKAITSDLVLAEIAWVCRSVYGIERKVIADILRGILDLPNLKIESDPDPVLAVKFYRNHSIKFIDAMIASDSRIQNKEVVLVSYDDDFDKLDIERKEPKELIE